MKCLIWYILLLTTFNLSAQNEYSPKEILYGKVEAKLLGYEKIKHLCLFQFEHDGSVVVAYTIMRNKKVKDCTEIIVGNTYPLDLCYELDIYPFSAINFEIEGVLITMKMRRSGPLYRILNLSELCLME